MRTSGAPWCKVGHGVGWGAGTAGAHSALPFGVPGLPQPSGTGIHSHVSCPFVPLNFFTVHAAPSAVHWEKLEGEEAAGLQSVEGPGWGCVGRGKRALEFGTQFAR